MFLYNKYFHLQDFKKTIKLTWLGVASDKPEATFTPTTAIYYDHIISKPGTDKNSVILAFLVLINTTFV